MRIALAPTNPTIGAIDANARLVEASIAQARERGADLVLFPELVICGYPPQDLLLEEGFARRCAGAIERIAGRMPRGITACIGTPARTERGLANALVAIRDGAVIARHEKRLLPTYDVFDEDRYFVRGDRPVVVDVCGVGVGLAVCEDLWRGEDARALSRYAGSPDPIAELARAGAGLVLVASASPVVIGKDRVHADLLARHARAHGVSIASVNQCGANDELIFDGDARALDATGSLIALGREFSDDLVVFDLPASVRGDRAIEEHPPQPDEARVFEALRMGVRDYFAKTGFERALLGLSGGIDSAVVCAIAAAALGPDRVTGIRMPSAYSSDHSLTDADELARRLGVRTITIPISGAVESSRAMLDPGLAELGERALGETMPDIAEENLQSRIRGNIVMALSNRTGALVLTTGNKSEIAVGYCTLYGDMNGALAVLSDLLKTRVYDLARWMNREHARCGFASPPIPERIITKPPSAELAPGQFDSDSLPAYEILDEIVRRFVEDRQRPETISAQTGFDAAQVARIVRLIERNEYKRRQMATGLKLSPVAFGVGRRIPIARGVE